MASIQRRDNGKWRARYRDDASKEHARHFERKVDAQRWLDEVTAQIVTGAYADPKAGRATFDAWFREWSSRQVWAAMTEVQADLVRRSLTFGDVPLAQLRESHLQLWVKQMQARGLAPNTINTRVMTVKAALKAAVRDRRLVSDPSLGVVLPRRANRAKAMEVATTEQVGRLLAATTPEMRAYIGLCAFAGLRLGEASAIQVVDVDFLRRRMEVERQIQKRRGGPPEVKPPKYESSRTVYVPDELLSMLAQHIEAGWSSAEGWLFPGVTGRPLSPSTVDHWWRRTAASAGVQGVTIHSLRHHFASGLIADGCDVVTVQRALGHKSPSVTLNTYSHLWPTAEDRTRVASGRLAAAALGLHVADSPRTEEVN
ncbi:tyrosine-type recombinase/integrase [Nocardioides cynanchi]|uniref:tyrosine-type recombinase/integrase n=1 Tax=Nocardioides cynanchi TaxID=2558918 RepID=UPI00124696E4|nr:site-specific integrase [Nocardioides cynanchi]